MHGMRRLGSSPFQGPDSMLQEPSTIDEDRDFAVYGEGQSVSSSEHASDEDIPRALWLPDFELVRKQKEAASAWELGGLDTRASLAGRSSLLGRSSIVGRSRQLG